MTYHIAANFGTEYSYHTSFSSNSKDKNELIIQAKKQLTLKMKEWGFEGKQLVSFDLYFYEYLDEVLIFKYKKDE